MPSGTPHAGKEKGNGFRSRGLTGARSG